MSDNKNIEPILMDGITDYHVHCDYSFDAKGTIEEYCEAALKRNLAEICFTTHFDSNPNGDGTDNFIRINNEMVPTTIENLAPYVEHVQKASDTYFSRGLSIKLGVEFGWYPNAEEKAAKLKEAYPFDYFLCGIHEIDDVCFCCRARFEECFTRVSLEKTLEKYFEQVKAASDSKLFDTIAHLCYYLKYGIGYYGDKILEAHDQFFDDLFKTLIKNDTQLEVNTSAIRHGHSFYYPPVDIVNRAKKAGVMIFHTGSDAHHPTQIGLDFEKATSLIPSSIRVCED